MDLSNSKHLALIALAVAFLASIAPGQRVTNDTLNFPSSFTTGDYELDELLSVTSILAIASPDDGSGNVFLAERQGRITIVTNLENGETAPSPFLDISSRVTSNSENGLLGLAFHPQYETNGYFYVFYTTNASGQATDRVSRFTRSQNDPLLADNESEFVLFDQRDEAGNHNGGAIHFGLDGYLYVALGDEGGGGDNFRNGQRIDKDLFAGLLRLDVDKKPANVEPTNHPAIPRNNDDVAPFSIPLDNPLVSHWQDAGANRDSDLRLEFYAIGLRNPWHFDIDPLTGDIWLSDVGQSSYEEINLIEKGGNYGWPNREGAHNYSQNRDVPPEFGALIDPVFEYGRELGSTVSGGVVYRGATFPELYGAYIFSEFFFNHAWAIQWDEQSSNYQTTRIGSFSSVSAYGRDPQSGELLAGNIMGGLGILTRTDADSDPTFPETLSETGAFTDLAALQPEAGIYSYEPNLPFWSDHAVKTRWVSIPGAEQIRYAQDGNWSFPEGSIWIKHFELETERGNPDTRKRIETRFLVKTNAGAYGLSYQWNEMETEASLVPPEGSSIEIPVTVDGQVISQTWQIPSRQQCLGCHTPAAGYALSFNTRQLNTLGTHEGQAENTLAYFSRLGVLDTNIASTQELPRYYEPEEESATLEERARSYLAVNCVSCHQPNGGTPSSWDARPHISLDATGLINGIPANNGGDSEKRLFVPGSPENSVLLDRMAARDGFRRMPPFGNNLTDPAGLSLLTRWIASHGAETLFQEWQALHFSSTTAPKAASNADPDGDGNSNRLEFLTDTLPLDPMSKWTPQFTRDQDALTVRFSLIPGRSFVIQKSADLSTWSDWEADGNSPQAASEQTVDALVRGSLLNDQDEQSFYRVTVEE
ncbi:PQQ-dependent sugar dehydrogenase [Pelagicoccus sp. SDUM812002]|uniref:PQQ-dependent sugar dehydrogenase n=1 Tax=Pelagicoccus sp. SDUM812002 TaxID=3041266 RepID=UPI00280D6D23|nr:PQQ-dependent sugar dehydrogenase [Pelagicoccus sp. SDUM812002]MDQ8184388.1 PQQ-dependent sugar dehydrogenase [Pelagicoccus sp. SDUM812002]